MIEQMDGLELIVPGNNSVGMFVALVQNKQEQQNGETPSVLRLLQFVIL